MKLTTRQKNVLEKHQKTHGHSKKHMEYMKRKCEKVLALQKHIIWL